jgi:protein-disulfide isomerase
MRTTLLASALVVASGCATTQAATSSPAQSPIVARYGTTSITLAEVDKKAGDDLFKAQEALYDLRSETAERVALEAMVEAEAKKEKVSEAEWLEKRVSEGLQAPREAELRALFEQAKSRIPPGTEYEDVKPQLQEALERRAKSEKARALFDELKKKNDFVLLLEAPARPRKVVDATGPSRGPADAKVTIVEFADFQCPYCSRAAQTVDKVLARYPGQVRLVFRHFPLSFHEKAQKASEAAACAQEQGHFWQFYDVLFADQSRLDVDALKASAAKLQLDSKKFDECLDSGRASAAVVKDLEAGQELGVRGTPAFFVNGVMLDGAQSEDAFGKLIDAELKR